MRIYKFGIPHLVRALSGPWWTPGLINLLCTCLFNKFYYYANTCLVQIAEQRHCFSWVVDVALMLGSVLGLWEEEVTYVTPFLELVWLPAWGPHHRPVRSMTVPHSLTKPVWLMWMWGSLSGQWEGEVTSHPSWTGGAPGIHVIYFCHIFYIIWQITTINTIIMIMPQVSVQGGQRYSYGKLVLYATLSSLHKTY